MDLEKAWNDWNDRKRRERKYMWFWAGGIYFFFLFFPLKKKKLLFLFCFFFELNILGGFILFQIDNHKHKSSGDFLALDIN